MMARFLPGGQDPELARRLAEFVLLDVRLPEAEARKLAQQYGCSARSVYRGLKAMRTNLTETLEAATIAEQAMADIKPAAASWPIRSDASPASADDGPSATQLTALQAIEKFGPNALWFDAELVGLTYLHGGNVSRLHRELVELGYPVPKLTTFWRRWQDLRPLVRDGAKNGLVNRAGKTLHIRHTAANSNDVWQLDAFNLDIEVLAARGKVKVPCRPTLLLLIDDHSRYCVGWALIDRQSCAEDITAVLGAAFETWVEPGSGQELGGLPQLLIVDNEAAIVSEHVRQALVTIPVAVRPAPAHTPIAKGKVERAGQTIQEMVVTGKAGVRTKAAYRNGEHLYDLADADLMDFDDFAGEVVAVIAAYNDSPMAALGGRTRREVYVADSGVPRILDDETLAGLMMPVGRGGTRRMHHDGIHLANTYFVAPELADYIGFKRKLQVRRWHHRIDRVAVLDPTGRFIAMARRVDLLDDADREGIVLGRVADEQAVTAAARYARKYMAAAAVQRDLDGSGLRPASGDDPDQGEMIDDNPAPAPPENPTDDVDRATPKPRRARPQKSTDRGVQGRGSRAGRFHGSSTAAAPGDDVAERARALMRSRLAPSQPLKEAL